MDDQPKKKVGRPPISPEERERRRVEFETHKALTREYVRRWGKSEVIKLLMRQLHLNFRNAQRVYQAAEKDLLYDSAHSVEMDRAVAAATWASIIREHSREKDRILAPESEGGIPVAEFERREKLLSAHNRAIAFAERERLRMVGGYAPAKIHVVSEDISSRQREFIQAAAVVMGARSVPELPAHMRLGKMIAYASGKDDDEDDDDDDHGGNGVGSLNGESG